MTSSFLIHNHIFLRPCRNPGSYSLPNILTCKNIKWLAAHSLYGAIFYLYSVFAAWYIHRLNCIFWGMPVFLLITPHFSPPSNGLLSGEGNRVHGYISRQTVRNHYFCTNGLVLWHCWLSKTDDVSPKQSPWTHGEHRDYRYPNQRLFQNVINQHLTNLEMVAHQGFE